MRSSPGISTPKVSSPFTPSMVSVSFRISTTNTTLATVDRLGMLSVETAGSLPVAATEPAEVPIGLPPALNSRPTTRSSPADVSSSCTAKRAATPRPAWKLFVNGAIRPSLTSPVTTPAASAGPASAIDMPAAAIATTTGLSR